MVDTACTEEDVFEAHVEEERVLLSGVDDDRAAEIEERVNVEKVLWHMLDEDALLQVPNVD